MAICRGGKCDGYGFLQGEKYTRESVDGKPIVYTPFDRCDACHPSIAEPKKVLPAVPNNPRHLNLREQAHRWIQKHMAAAMEMLQYAQELKKVGQHFGIGLIYEHFRYEAKRRNWNQGDYMLNNNLRAYVARWMIEQDEDLIEYIELREVRFR